MQETQEKGVGSWVGKIPWRSRWQPTPVFLPGESHGRRSLEDYSPWGRKEEDKTEHAHILKCTMEYYSTTKRNEILAFSTTRMNLEGIMLGETERQIQNTFT